jgi:hypothetical protein
MQMIYGDLTLEIPEWKNSEMHWQCRCRCGKTKTIREQHLKKGRSKSCGLCNYHNDHPFAHKSWDSMHQRCQNPNSPDYKDYGGRGIKVCLKWLRFIDFLDDMGDPPTDAETGNRYTLDRKDNDGDYTPDNCKWSSQKEQSNNQRSTLPFFVRRYSSGNRRTAPGN